MSTGILVKYLDALIQLTEEEAVGEYAARELKKSGFSTSIDSAGNVQAKRGNGKLPLLSAHLDTRQSPMDWKIIHDFYSEYGSMYNGGVMTLKNAQIAGDDKCGIAIILSLAKSSGLKFKALLTIGEERGSVGAKVVPDTFFEDVSFAISLDRRGKNDIIQEYGGKKMATDEFVKEVEKASEEVGGNFKVARGIFSDTFFFARPTLSAVNLSVGYYGEHANNDKIVVNETLTTMNLVKTLLGKDLSHLSGVPEHLAFPPKPKIDYNSQYLNYFDYTDYWGQGRGKFNKEFSQKDIKQPEGEKQGFLSKWRELLDKKNKEKPKEKEYPKDYKQSYFPFEDESEVKDKKGKSSRKKWWDVI